MSDAMYDQDTTSLARPALLAEGLTKCYAQGESEIRVLNRAQLRVEPGERLAIVGRSGSGKSTLLHILAGLDTADQGTVRVGGVNLAEADSDLRAAIRGRYMGFVYQNHHLLPEFSALENVGMPLRIMGFSRGDAETQSLALLNDVGLGERLHHTPGQLSGGERQRVAVARALAGAPHVVLADEPTGNLDADSADSVMQLITRLSRERGIAFVVVTHDISMLSLFDRTLQLADGSLVPYAGD